MMERMGKAISYDMDFFLWLIGNELGTSCSCGKVYRYKGWLRRHYRRTRHWKVADSK